MKAPRRQSVSVGGFIVSISLDPGTQHHRRVPVNVGGTEQNFKTVCLPLYLNVGWSGC